MKRVKGFKTYNYDKAYMNLLHSPNNICYCIVCNGELLINDMGVRAHLRKHIRLNQLDANVLLNAIKATLVRIMLS